MKQIQCKVTRGAIPQGAVIGTVKPCETCGAEMLLMHSQRRYRICGDCAAKIAAADPMGDIRNLLR